MQTIGIFCGGLSSEFDISLKSAETILTNLPSNYRALKVIVSEGAWKSEFNGQQGVFDLNTCSATIEGDSVHFDAAIVYIHGNPGENGKIQAYLDLFEKPYVNPDVLASALSFDKWYCNQFLKSFGFPVAKSVFLGQGESYEVSKIVEDLSLPLFVKPTGSGSSYGISKVKHLDELDTAIASAFKEGPTIVLESFLDGIEVTCGVFRNQESLMALPLTEIVSENDFFDYEAKYLGKSQEITPARISDESRIKIQNLAKEVYKVLRLRSIARIDFILVDETPYIIEVNTTPGFSKESIVPKMLAVEQMSISTFWEIILSTELEGSKS
jgi:D-alanine-D-alanine ligase